jgi:hypothetical protein
MSFRIRTHAVVVSSSLLAACLGGTFLGFPFVSSVNGVTAPSGSIGSQVIITGLTFGGIQGSSQVFFANSLGGTTIAATIASPSDWTNTYIITTVPNGAFTGPIVVQTGGGTGGGQTFAVTPTPPEVSFTPSAVAWTAGPALPDSVSGNAVTFAQIRTAGKDTGYVYSVGGAGNGGTPVTTVSYAGVTTPGSLEAWKPATALPTGVAFAAAAAATQRSAFVSSTGYLYVVGGVGNSAGTIYRAAINGTNGTLGTWSSAATLPAPLHSMAAMIYRGSLYVLGGAANSNNAPVATAYRYPIQADGSLGLSGSGTPVTEGSLPAPRARLSLGVYGLYMYAVGGDSTARSPNDSVPTSAQTASVYYAKMNVSSHDVAGWSATGSLDVARAAHTTIVAGAGILVTGGVYSGGTHDSYAAVTVTDGTVGTFSTVSGGPGGLKLFNQGATGFLGVDGSFHVLVAGGDDVNAAGTKQVNTFIY